MEYARITRVNRNELQEALEHARTCAAQAGLDSRGWALTYGRQSEGRQYKLWTSPETYEALGIVQRVAYEKLQTMARAWEMISERVSCE